MLQGELRQEEGELGAFQAFSVLAAWVRGLLDGGVEDDAVARTFRAIERLIVEDRFPLGDALAAELIEGVWDHPEAHGRMGRRTRERARPSADRGAAD